MKFIKLRTDNTAMPFYNEFIISWEEIKMKRYGKEFTIDNFLMEIISAYMNNDIKEEIHCELAPCQPEVFLSRYIEFDPGFEELLKEKFKITFH